MWTWGVRRLLQEVKSDMQIAKEKLIKAVGLEKFFTQTKWINISIWATAHLPLS